MISFMEDNLVFWNIVSVVIFVVGITLCFTFWHLLTDVAIFGKRIKCSNCNKKHISESDGKPIWRCPKCGFDRREQMHDPRADHS